MSDIASAPDLTKDLAGRAMLLADKGYHAALKLVAIRIWLPVNEPTA